MRSPEYYKQKAKQILFRVFWLFCGAAVMIGWVDFFYVMNTTGQLPYWHLLGLLGGLCAVVKVNVTH